MSFTGGKNAACGRPVSPDNGTIEGPRRSVGAETQGTAARRASVSAHTLTFALLPSPASNFPLSSLAARPPNRKGEPRSLGRSCQLS